MKAELMNLPQHYNILCSPTLVCNPQMVEVAQGKYPTGKLAPGKFPPGILLPRKKKRRKSPP